MAAVIVATTAAATFCGSAICPQKSGSQMTVSAVRAVSDAVARVVHVKHPFFLGHRE